MESRKKLQDGLGDTIAGAETSPVLGFACSSLDPTPTIPEAGDDPGSPDNGSQVSVPRNESQSRPCRSYTTAEDVIHQSDGGSSHGTLSAPQTFDDIRAAGHMHHVSGLKPPTPTEDTRLPPFPTSSPRSQVAPSQQSHDVNQMTDLEAQVVAPGLQNQKNHVAAPEGSQESTVPPGPSPGTAADQNSRRSSEDYDDEQVGLYDLAEKLRNADPAVEPWFLEMSRLRRIYILWLNKRLSLCRKSILGNQQASDEDMEALGEVLHLQGKIIEGASSQRMTDLVLAEAIRDLQTVRALDFL